MRLFLLLLALGAGASATATVEVVSDVGGFRPDGGAFGTPSVETDGGSVTLSYE